MKKVIVCHSFPAWDTPYIKSTIELLKQLSADHRVIMIDYHYTLKDLFFNKFAPVKQILGLSRRTRTFTTNQGAIEVISTPPILPINWIKHKGLFKAMARLNAWVIGRSIKKQLQRSAVDSYTLVNAFNPVYGYYCRSYFAPLKTVYYCYDEIAATEWSGVHGAAYEERFMPLADEVICTSSVLKRNKSELAKQIQFIPNGVNLDLFLAPHKEKSNGSTIGYIGAIDSRIDFDLVAHCAMALPEFEFQFYGPVKTTLPKLPANVKMLGAVAQELLPEKVQAFDVCLIPFVKSKLTEAIYPLKINEYLAMGKAVVCTDFSDLSDFEKVAEIATDKDGFVKAIRKALRYNTRLKTQKRIEFAKQNSWEHRARQFAEALSA
jgi:glycosyltransferase involved in cell wall biosynthesis